MAVQHAVGMGFPHRPQEAASQPDGFLDGERASRQPLLQRPRGSVKRHAEQELFFQSAIQERGEPGAAQVAQDGVIPQHALECPHLQGVKGDGLHHHCFARFEVCPSPALYQAIPAETLLSLEASPHERGVPAHARVHPINIGRTATAREIREYLGCLTGALPGASPAKHASKLG